ncbi:MAG: DUF6600 domain-containing protein [Myxococcales bacterium]|nr:hypothetical protein [Myxococcales bacterium]
MKRLILAALLVVSAGAHAQQYEEPPPPPPPDEDSDVQAPPPPQTQPTQQAFDQELAPYGHWVVTPEYGRVWVPSVSGDWQPYSDGRWVDSPSGWTFVSYVPWGNVVFHYGRWGWGPRFGWYWVPGFQWAPAWVSWRWMNGYACWSPLAPRGYVYGRTWPGWVVVPHAHFTAPIRRWAIPHAQIGVIVRSARPVRTFPSWRMHADVGRWHRGHGRRR